jgi:hypothetical protein
MISVVGVFNSRYDLPHALHELEALGIAKTNIKVLTPEFAQEGLEEIPTSQGEQPGMVKTIGAVAGGALGLGLGEVVASLLVPGAGPVLAIGLAGGALLGSITGGALGGSLEESVFPGLPEHELFIYEDALRQGRSLIFVAAEDSKQAAAARDLVEGAGAESIDRAREMWWLGLRDVEKEKYESTGGKFQEDEHYFRCGFEAALHIKNRDRSYADCQTELGERDRGMSELEAFRHGYERGRTYLQASQKNTDSQSRFVKSGR